MTDTDADTTQDSPEARDSDRYRPPVEVVDDALTFEERNIQKHFQIDLNPAVIEHLNIDGNVVDLTVHTDTDSIRLNDVDPWGGNRYRFTIPARKRDLYDVEVGETVKVTIENVHREDAHA